MLTLITMSGWIVAIFLVLILLWDQRAYDHRIKGLEKAYKKAVYKSIEKCKDGILARAKREAYEEYKELNRVLEGERDEHERETRG